MQIGVVRFGGNSFNDERILDVFVKEARPYEKNLVVVVSAIPQIQNILNDGLSKLISQTISYKTIIDDIQNELNTISPSRFMHSDQLFTEIGRLEGILQGIQYAGDFSSALRDQVISFSERISALWFYAYLKEKELSVNIFLPEEIKFTVSDEFGNASVLLKENIHLGSLNFQQICLIPGSYGINQNGKIARLGDNTADYSAASLTQILKASCLELWGIDQSFTTADPKIVQDSVIIQSLTYSEASELSYFSHTSLHPRIVEPLVEDHIPIRVFKFSDTERILETTINSESFVSPKVVKSIVHDDEIAVLRLDGPGVGFKPGILAQVTSAFHQSGINIRSVVTSQTSINIILEKEDVRKAKDICSKLGLASVNQLLVLDHVSLIAVVGHGMQAQHGISASLFKAVADYKINVLLSGSGASYLVSYLVIDQNDRDKAIREIHKTFFKEV